MGRSAKPAKRKVQTKRPPARELPKDAGARASDLEQRLAEALQREAAAARREADALEHQAATVEILGVISRSPADAQPVFDAIAVNALRLCEAKAAVVVRYDSTLLHLAAHHNVDPEFVGRLERQFPRAADRRLPIGRAVLDGAVVHVPDLQAAEEFSESFAREFGARSNVSIPLLHEGRTIGAIGISRPTLGPFSDRQIALLQTFADQAVIAIENVRLFTELQQKNEALTQAHAHVTESLNRQTATAEILRVISRSQTDPQPVFDAIAVNARRLLRAYGALVVRVDGQRLHVAAHAASGGRETSTEEHLWEQLRERFPRPVDRETFNGAVIFDRCIHQIADVETDERWAYLRAHARSQGWRANLGVPMLHDGKPIGAISVTRSQPGSFSPQDVELLQTFADQAVIAIENVRLFTELQQKNQALTQAHAQVSEALEKQTATSEILGVIASSPTDLQPVLDAVVRSAARLCAAVDAAIFRVDGGSLRLVAHDGVIPPTMPVGTLVSIGRDSVNGRAVLDGRAIHVPDLQLAVDEFPEGSANARRIGWRTTLVVPLMREHTVVGTIAVRRTEARPFSDTQIDLLTTFADQAAIAIENVRLFNELQQKNEALTHARDQISEALEQQTATSEILRVISSSPTDAQPVFDTITQSALSLCGAASSLLTTFDGELLHLAALANVRPEDAEFLSSRFPQRPDQGTPGGRAILTGAAVHIPDVREDPYFRKLREAGQSTKVQSILTVPLVREGQPIGTLHVHKEPGFFPERQIALLKTFANQAVIAIENVRLFNETKEALERQTATAEILRVISSSPTDVQPVFDAIVSSAVTLCGAILGAVYRREGDLVQLVGIDARYPEAAAVRGMCPAPVTSGLMSCRAIHENAVIHVPDAEAEGALPPEGLKLAQVSGFRSIVAVPMRREGTPIGSILIGRPTLGPFPDKQIALLQTFADQAVIAIENVRLFKELEARTQDLTRSVGELRALGEVGQAISSTLDLKTVLTTIVSQAIQLSRLDGGVVLEYDTGAEEFVHRAQAGTGGTLAAERRANRIRKGEGVIGRTAITLEPIQISDITVAGAYVGRHRENLIESGVRALLAVPMVREGQLIGCLGVTRNRPGEFPAETIDLLRTFATQSALAIQNARLFAEVEDKSRQLEVASRHKSEFLASMSHELRTPLNGILGFNEMILDEVYGEVSPDLREPLTEIQNSGRHLLRLINNVLDLSKIEAGRMELALGDYAVQDTVAQVRASLHALAADKGLEFVTAVPADLPLAHGDAGRIAQCLTNLAGNAIKFTRQGRVEIAVELQGELLVYRVSDTGIGIEPDRIGTLFTEFRQADPTIASEFGGSGLGLSITRKFAEMHGGRVWVESEPGTGSRFFLAVPLRARGGAPA
jgi:GAF domain-containing protein